LFAFAKTAQKTPSGSVKPTLFLCNTLQIKQASADQLLFNSS
jgi:hypothetical protein